MDGRSNTSAENGKKGGRPKGYSAIEAEQARILLIEKLKKDLPDIYNALAEKAMAGDVPAAKELFDRAYGRAQQYVDLTTDGESLKIMFDEVFNKNGITSSTEEDSK